MLNRPCLSSELQRGRSIKGARLHAFCSMPHAPCSKALWRLLDSASGKQS